MRHKETIQGKAKLALKEAIRDLLKVRRLANDKVVIWKNGRVARVSAKKV